MSHATTGRMRAVVRGRVQGVGYRAFAAEQAARLGLRGWVRNLMDGGVEVLVEGDRSTLDLFHAQLERGPRLAHVSAVSAAWESVDGDIPASFEIRGTA